MQAHLLMVGPIPINASSSSGLSFSSPVDSTHLGASPSTSTSRSQPRHHRWGPLVFSSSFPAHPDHYAVLGLTRNATFAHVKRAYRLLARKYHPDVSKDSQASEVFKRIRHAYEVLSNEATRTQCDQNLKFQEDTDRRYRGKWNHGPEYEDRTRIYRWAELRLKMQHERYWESHTYNVNEENSSDDEADEMFEEGSMDQERGPFTEMLRSTLLSLFILRCFGSRWSLTFSSLMALFDRRLDAGYNWLCNCMDFGWKGWCFANFVPLFCKLGLWKNQQQHSCFGGGSHVGRPQSCKVCTTSTGCSSHSSVHVY